jgi:hypothetical protein
MLTKLYAMVGNEQHAKISWIPTLRNPIGRKLKQNEGGLYSQTRSCSNKEKKVLSWGDIL